MRINQMFGEFLHRLTFQRQLGIAVSLGILMLTLFSSVVGTWLANERVRGNLLEQGRHITETLARQSTLALIYASSDNAAEAANATLEFPGVIGVEIRDANRKILLKRGKPGLEEFKIQAGLPDVADGRGEPAAVLDAESASAWRFASLVYSQPANSPFHEEAAPELLGFVTVVVSKAELAQLTTSIFIANVATSLSFALLFLLLIRFLTGRMTQPLNQLATSMGRAEAGELQVQAELSGPRDIADMAHAFNSMMSVLEARAQEIRQLNAELEQRVEERTAQLEAANKELEAFSYSVSHDLRAPLRAVDGFSKILQEDYAGKLDDEGKRLLNVVRDNAGRMGQLIDDILRFSRTGRTGIAYSEIDMEKQAREVFVELQPAVGDGKLHLEVEALPPARGDSAMMHQVFANLISNAIKFSRTRDEARIKVGGYVEGGEAIYYVRDNGVGFDMQYADKLFGVFQRLHTVNEFEGTGIGLAIVKRIVARHGGRVWAEGKLNEGTTIYFALPTKEAAHG